MKNRMWRACAGAVAVLGWRCRARRHSAQQKTEISLSRQPGIFYMPSHIMEKQKLIEKHAAALGVPGVTTKWINLSGGGAQTDALLAGGVDILNTGTGNLLLLWDRTRGGVKGIVATSAQPMTLISRDANIKSIKDFGPNDKIAVPTVKVSTQAIVLQIAAAEAVRRRPMVEARCQHRAARPSRRLCGDDQRPARGAQSLLRSRRSRSSN